jgi:hypothetical protein
MPRGLRSRGHTDLSGLPAYNQALSERRAFKGICLSELSRDLDRVEISSRRLIGGGDPVEEAVTSSKQVLGGGQDALEVGGGLANDQAV